jgi:hypothetical protein
MIDENSVVISNGIYINRYMKIYGIHVSSVEICYPPFSSSSRLLVNWVGSLNWEKKNKLGTLT